MIRLIYLELLQKSFKIFSICAILGARQDGKTTLARQFGEKYFQEKVEFFNLDNPTDLASLENPMLTLSKYDGYLIVIDEFQRKPELLPILQILANDPIKEYKFLILGNISKKLIEQSTKNIDTIGFIEFSPFTFFELSQENSSAIDISNKLLNRGCYPRSYLAKSDKDSFSWRQDYITTFLERDLSSFGLHVSPQTMYKFWMMLCFYQGQNFNASEIAKSLMLSDKTVTSYLNILSNLFIIRILPAWIEDIPKRQIKTPKIYFRDTGIYNTLLSIHSMQELARNPKVGSLWEGFALEQVITCFQIPSKDCYFWATSNHAELDLLVFRNGKRIGFEFKYTDSPKITKSMHIALQDLKLDHLYVIYPGSFTFPLHEQMTVCGFDALHEIKI